MGNFLNALNILGWTSLICSISYKFILNPVLFFNQDISLEVALLTFVQTFQVIDILLIIIGKSKGSLLGSIAQITGRLVVVWLFVEEESNRFSFAWMVLMWSIADIVRYFYYMNKGFVAASLRYNMFLVLYPFGVYGEMKVITDYIRRHAQTLEVDQIFYIRVVQGSIILGMCFIYLYMLKMRSKFYSKGSEKSSQNKTVKRQ